MSVIQIFIVCILLYVAEGTDVAANTIYETIKLILIFFLYPIYLQSVQVQ
jgi:hypothetical protein